jgi:hypothetical protein
MKTNELFPQLELFEAARAFEVEHHYGRSSRKHTMTSAQIMSSILFSPAEKKKIESLAVGEELTLKHSDVQLRITRKT